MDRFEHLVDRFDLLPIEILLHLLNRCDDKTVVRFMSTCTAYRNLIDVHKLRICTIIP